MVNQAPSLVRGHCLAVSPPSGAAEQARQERQAYCSPDPSQKQLWQYQFLPDVRLACVSELTALGFDSNDYNGGDSVFSDSFELEDSEMGLLPSPPCLKLVLSSIRENGSAVQEHRSEGAPRRRSTTDRKDPSNFATCWR